MAFVAISSYCQKTLVSIVFYNTNPNNCDRIETSKENRTERTVKGVWNEDFRRLFCFGRKEGSIMDVRMQEHPILGAMGLSKKVKFQGTLLRHFSNLSELANRAAMRFGTHISLI